MNKIWLGLGLLVMPLSASALAADCELSTPRPTCRTSASRWTQNGKEEGTRSHQHLHPQ